MHKGWGAAVAAIAMAAGCTSGGDSHNFTRRLEDGASCAELFEIRNRVDIEVERMNEQLRAIGCFSSTSERTD